MAGWRCSRPSRTLSRVLSRPVSVLGKCRPRPAASSSPASCVALLGLETPRLRQLGAQPLPDASRAVEQRPTLVAVVEDPVPLDLGDRDVPGHHYAVKGFKNSCSVACSSLWPANLRSELRVASAVRDFIFSEWLIDRFGQKRRLKSGLGGAVGNCDTILGRHAV